MAPLKMLSLAFTAKRMGYVFLNEAQLIEWRVSEKATRSPHDAAGTAQELINLFQPEVVVTEKIAVASCRKGTNARSLIAATQRLAAENYVLDISVERTQDHANKYAEALFLAARYPELMPWVPQKRQAWQTEPHRMVMFEALSLAHSVLEQPATKLAAAMESGN